MPKVDESIWLQRWESEGGALPTSWTGAVIHSANKAPFARPAEFIAAGS